jgi:hypothetical protein
MMFTDLVKVKPERSFILKVSKEDGRYSTEELTKIPQLVAGAKKVIAAAEAVEKIKQLRQKSNAKKVIAI